MSTAREFCLKFFVKLNFYKMCLNKPGFRARYSSYYSSPVIHVHIIMYTLRMLKYTCVIKSRLILTQDVVALTWSVALYFLRFCANFLWDTTNKHTGFYCSSVVPEIIYAKQSSGSKPAIQNCLKHKNHTWCMGSTCIAKLKGN